MRPTAGSVGGYLSVPGGEALPWFPSGLVPSGGPARGEPNLGPFWVSTGRVTLGSVGLDGGLRMNGVAHGCA